MFTNITRGGQIQIHQLRMMQQIVCFAFLISFAISFSIFCYGIAQDIPWLQAKRNYRFIEAKVLASLSAVIDRTPISTINRADRIAAERSISIIKQRAQQAGIYFTVSFPVIFGIWFLYGKRQKKTDIIKGKRLISPKELKKLIVPSDLKIGELPLVKYRELQHILVTGTTGAGKSTFFNILLPQIRQRPNNAIIVDVTGEYIAKFYRPATDLIFNPLDARSVNWDIWADCHLESHYEAFAASIIPSKKHQTDDIWDASSRAVMVEVMRKLAGSKKPTISKLLNISNYPGPLG